MIRLLSASAVPAVIDPPISTDLVVVITAFGVKPLYMILAGVILWILARRPGADLRLLFFGFAAFLTGEILCALNYALSIGLCDPLEIGHQAGMVVFGALVPWGLYRMIDRRVVRFSDPEGVCSGNRFCRACWKRDNVSCGFHRLFAFFVPALALICLMPLAAPLRPLSVRLRILWNIVPYATSETVQWVEFRLFPVLGAALLLVAFVVLLRGRDGVRRAELPFFAGFGFFVFSVPRFFLFMAYHPMRPWSDAFEEVTELIVVVAALIMLRAFRGPLGLTGRAGQDRHSGHTREEDARPAADSGYST